MNKPIRLTLSLVALLIVPVAYAQELNKDIDRYRKGEFVIKAKPGASVVVEQLQHKFWFGAAISNGFVDGHMQPADKAQYEQKFLQNFNSAVTENAVKWLSMEREQGKVIYSVVDSMLAWTDRHHIPLRGHNLFWGIDKFVQPWLKEMNDAELRATLQRRAESVTSRYRGRFAEYDLNNEMVHGNYYEQRLGNGITKDMATWAHNGDPGAKLFLNDYDITTGNKLPEYMMQIRSLLKQGVPIAGIGVQGHLHAETFDRKELKRALDSLAIFKLPIRITEFNVPGQRSRYYKENIRTMTQEAEAEKAKELTDFYRICFAHPAVEGILMWGFWEGANWIPVSSLYHTDWSPTPAAIAYQNLLFKEWWTKSSGKAGKDGTFKVRAFYGKYKVTIDGVVSEREFN
ncbi:endo-1,4-beta-xylanase [Chryseolinea sp. T2]|uniref:endo-1,4-beta-xylanase n=1 Tax=Chryseolinea sp. T2 TaxID=3129255 RepID=UPI00307713E3